MSPGNILVLGFSFALLLATLFLSDLVRRYRTGDAGATRLPERSEP